MKRYLLLVSLLGVATACGSGASTAPTPVPTPATAVSFLTVSGNTPPIGGASQFNATVTFANGTTQNVNSQASWQSSNASVAAVISGGVVTSIAPGQAAIVATYQGVSGTTQIVVVASVFTLNGTVTDGTSGGVLPNILLQITNGPNAGASSHSDGSGNYSFNGVSAATFTLSASATGYQIVTQQVTVAGNTRLNIVLQRVAPAPPPPSPTPTPGPGGANLVPTGPITLLLCVPLSSTLSSCVYNGLVVNQGSGCASNIAGTTVAFDRNGLQTGVHSWIHVGTVVPGQQFVYTGSPLILATQGGRTSTQVTWRNVACF